VNPILIVDLLLGLSVLLTALSINSRDLLLAVVLSGAEGVLVSILFYLLLAPDIALIQISAAVGVASAFLVLALKKLKRYEET
jgi:energy-converting hydrogenase B subunit D